MANNDEIIFQKLDELLNAVHSIDKGMEVLKEQVKEINRHREEWEREACQITNIEKDIIQIKADQVLANQRFKWVVSGVALISALVSQLISWGLSVILTLIKNIS